MCIILYSFLQHSSVVVTENCLVGVIPATFAGAIYELCRSRVWQMRSEKPYDVPSQESLRLPIFLANHKTNHDRSGLVPQKQRLRARLACSQTGDNLKKCNRKKVYVKRRGQEETEWYSTMKGCVTAKHLCVT